MKSNHILVEEFTTPDPVVAHEHMSVDELRDLMKEHAIRHLPVLRDGRVVGIISDRDLRLVSGLSVAEKFQVQAGDIMTPDPLIVRAGTPLAEVARLLAEKRIGSAIVEDRDNALLGIFTATDALNALITLIHELPDSPGS